MKSLSILLSTILVFTSIFGQTKFNASLDYNLTDLDSKITAEILTFNRTKLDLTHQIAQYIETTTAIANNQNLNNSIIKVLIPCVIDINLVKQKYTKKLFSIEIESVIDTSLISKRLERCLKIEDEVEKISELKNRSNNANLQIETLMRATSSEEYYQAKFQLLIEYVKHINVLKEEELFHKGYNSYLNHQFDSSKVYFSNMIELNHKSELAYYFLAQIYEVLSEDTDAILSYKKVLDYDPYFSEANYQLGILYMKNGDEYHGNQYLHRAARLNHKKAKNLLGPL